jgi:hypothetical protein
MSSPSNVEYNAWSCTTMPTYAFTAWTALSFKAYLTHFDKPNAGKGDNSDHE